MPRPRDESGHFYPFAFCGCVDECKSPCSQQCGNDTRRLIMYRTAEGDGHVEVRKEGASIPNLTSG